MWFGVLAMLVVFLSLLSSGGRSRKSAGGVSGESAAGDGDSLTMDVPRRLSMDPLDSFSDKRRVESHTAITANAHSETANLKGQVPNSSLSPNAYDATGGNAAGRRGMSTDVDGSVGIALDRLDVNHRRLEAAAATLGPATHWVLLNER